MTRAWQRGLYAITESETVARGTLATQAAAAIAGGAVIIQYRDKSAIESRRLAEARSILAVCHDHDVPLIINDDIALAAAVEADGVHLGRDDAAFHTARRKLGVHAIIGVSCYNDLPRAITAAAEGASYVAFGRFFSSLTKPQAVQANIEILRRAKQRVDVPVVAIGGINAENGYALISAGADLLAVSHGVFGRPDVMAAARSVARLFDNDAGEQQREVSSA